MTKEELVAYSNDRWERWQNYRRATDRQLVAAYRRALKAREMAEPQFSIQVKAFRRIESREDRIYFIISSEDVAIRRHKRLSQLTENA